MNDTQSNDLAILLEQHCDQNKVVLEAVADMRATLAQVPKRQEFELLKQDVKVIKAAVTDLSR